MMAVNLQLHVSLSDCIPPTSDSFSDSLSTKYTIFLHFLRYLEINIPLNERNENRVMFATLPGH